MENKDILAGLYNAIVELNPAHAQELDEELVKTSIDILEAVEKWMAPRMEQIGKKCQAGQIYLPELALSARVFRTAMNLFEPKVQGCHRGSTD